MKLESWLFLLLMVLKFISVIPLAYQNMGVGHAVFFAALTVIAYGTLIFFSETDTRKRVACGADS